MKKKISMLLFSAFFVVFIVSGYAVFTHFSEEKKQDSQYNLLIEKVAGANTEETVTNADKPSILPEYAELFEQNNELIGWIKIDGTQINYPVMQSKDTPDFYLKHLFDGAYSDYGCPYAEQRCDVFAPSDNVIIYGHHMRSDKMFSQLEKYKDEEFWAEHKYISFDTLYERQTYEIIAAFKTVVYTDDPTMFKYYDFIEADSDEAFDEYVSRAKAMSTYDTGVTARCGDKLITLSTCEFSSKNGRFVVVAKKVG